MSKLKVFTGESGGHSPGSYYKASPDAKVDPNSEESLERWGRVLELSRAQLIQAVKDFGPIVRNIRLGLRSEDEDISA